MPHESPQGDICEGLDNRYGGGFAGFGLPFGLDRCGFGGWLVAGGLAIATIAGAGFAIASDGGGSPYEWSQLEREYQYQIPDFSGGLELPGGLQFEYPND